MAHEQGPSVPAPAMLLDAISSSTIALPCIPFLVSFHCQQGFMSPALCAHPVSPAAENVGKQIPYTVAEDSGSE